MAQNGGTEPELRNALRLYTRVEMELMKSQKYILILSWGELPCPVIMCVIRIMQEFSFIYFTQTAEFQ